MILVRAPLRISFLGGGTDIPSFYHKSPGRVISATIDKFVYILINPTPLIDKFTVKYQKTEIVDHPSQLEHTRIKAALQDLGLTDGGIEIGSFADLPAKTGLGSSSSFSVALMKGLNTHLNIGKEKKEIAEDACNLEINLLNEPIGKQDQYAAAFGGFNVFEFNADESVEVEPVLVDYKNKLKLEDHLLLFFTGITRDASSVLAGQKSNIEKGEHEEIYKKMANSVLDFREALLHGDMEKLGKLLHEGWLSKKQLANNITNKEIDGLYDTALDVGAWGGKVLGAGGGGCLMILAPEDKHNNIRKRMIEYANSTNREGFREIPIRFSEAGAGILFSNKFIHRFT